MEATTENKLSDIATAALTTAAAAPTVIDRKHLASRWECSVMTIKRREREGLLKPIPISTRLVRYRLSDIEKIEKGESV